jgi:hypothetical protein
MAKVREQQCISWADLRNSRIAPESRGTRKLFQTGSRRGFSEVAEAEGVLADGVLQTNRVHAKASITRLRTQPPQACQAGFFH